MLNLRFSWVITFGVFELIIAVSCSPTVIFLLITIVKDISLSLINQWQDGKLLMSLAIITNNAMTGAQNT